MLIRKMFVIVALMSPLGIAYADETAPSNPSENPTGVEALKDKVQQDKAQVSQEREQIKKDKKRLKEDKKALRTLRRKRHHRREEKKENAAPVAPSPAPSNEPSKQ